MTSNLPPGVTGLEDHFGPRAVTHGVRECQATVNLRTSFLGWEDAVARVIENLSGLAHDVDDPTRAAVALRPKTQAVLHAAVVALGNVRSDVVEIEDAVCPYSGDVEVEWWSRGNGTWTCPTCGTQHEIEDEGPDPDDERDRQIDREMEDR